MKRIGYLFGRRVQGDIELDIDPITNLPGEIIAPGHRIAGRPEQDIYVVSDVQNYLLGSRRVVDERVFRYAKAGNALNCGLGAHIGYPQDVAFAAVTVDIAAIGSYTLEVTVAATDGRLGTGEIALDELAGGFIIIFPDGMGETMNRKVVGNTAVAAPGGAMTVTVDRFLNINLTPAPHAELIGCPWYAVMEGNYDRQMIMGMPAVPATVGQFLWLQTWGPCWVTPDGLAGVGIDNSQVMFRGNGSIAEFDGAPAPPVGQCQLAGTVMTPSSAGVQGAPFIWLQIAP